MATRLTKEERRAQLEAIAYHEAGHAVVAFLFGIPIGARGATIVRRGYRRGSVAISAIPADRQDSFSPDGQKETAIRYGMILIAGIESHVKYRPYPPKHLWKEVTACSSDYDVAFKFALDMTEGNPLRALAWLLATQRKTTDFISERKVWKLIESVAAALLERKTISGPDLTELMKRSQASIADAEHATSMPSQ